MKAFRLTLDMTLEIKFAKNTRRADLQPYLLAVQSGAVFLVGTDAYQAVKTLWNGSSELMAGEFWESEVSWQWTEEQTRRFYSVTGPIAFELKSTTDIPLADNIDGCISDVLIGFRQHGDAPLILPTKCTLIEGQISDCRLDLDFDEF